MAARTAVIKYKSRIKRALEMKNYSVLWVVIGRQTAWDDEEDPPTALPGTDDIEEPIVAVRPAVISMAKEVTEEAYNLLGEGYRAITSVAGIVKYLELVADEDAYVDAARILYLRATVDPVVLGHPGHDFRVYYVVSDLIPSAGYESATWLAPENIDSYGMLEYENSGGVILMDPMSGPGCYLPVIIEFK